MNAPDQTPSLLSPERLSPELLPLPVPGPVHGPAHRRRREALAQALRARGLRTALILVPSGEERARNRDNLFPFRFASDFFYLTGFPEPEAWLMVQLLPDGQTESLLFCRPRDPEREIWDGVRVGPEAAAERYGLDAALPLSALHDTVRDRLLQVEALVAPMAREPELDQQLRLWLSAARSQARAGKEAASQQLDLEQLLAPLRLRKDEPELATMARAGEISALTHIEAMQATRPGRAEFEIEAVLMSGFRRRGAQAQAYGAIVAGGPHSCILHHRAGDRVMRDGELLLIDAGCELDGYASDITRTFPVNGRFTPAQRDAYAVVLAAQEAAIAATRPGVAFTAPHEAAVRVLAQGMLDLGLLPQQSLDAAIESGSYRRFYMHRTGHWLGMDVHDVGSYRDPLEPQMVLTIEPGLYIRPADDIDPAFWNVGIRIEDDAVVTESGCRLLSRGVPVSISAIEDLMAQD